VKVKSLKKEKKRKKGLERMGEFYLWIYGFKIKKKKKKKIIVKF